MLRREAEQSVGVPACSTALHTKTKQVSDGASPANPVFANCGYFGDGHATSTEASFREPKSAARRVTTRRHDVLLTEI
jgi:hypothetical protein